MKTLRRFRPLRNLSLALAMPFAIFQPASHGADSTNATSPSLPEFQWAVRAGSVNDDRPGIELGHDVVADSAGNVYVAGVFRNTVDFDPGLGVFNLTSAGNNDTFVAKYSPAGALVWAVRMGGSYGDDDPYLGAEGPFGLAVGSDGHVHVTGFFHGTADFDPGPLTHNLTSPLPRGAGFVVKLDAEGRLVWAFAIGNAGPGYGNPLAVDAEGNVYLTGGFASGADLDPGSGVLTLPVSGPSDNLVCKFDRAGRLVWARGFGNPSTLSNADSTQGVSVDGTGNVYLATHFGDTVDFDPGAATFSLTSAGQLDIAVVKLNPTGDFVWARRLGGPGTDIAGQIQTDEAGDVFVSGGFSGTADFDPGSGTNAISSAGGFDGFVVKLNTEGDLVWARSVGGGSGDGTHAFAVDAASNVYLSGQFVGSGDFDPGPGIQTLTSAGAEDVFVLKLDPEGAFVWAGRAGGTGYDSAYGLILSQGTNVLVTGAFSRTADFDPATTVANLTAAGSGDMFLMKWSEQPVPPRIVVQPLGGTFMPGTSHSLSVTASGTSPLAYQWQRNGANIPGATARTLVLSDLVVENAGAYSVVVSNPVGSVTSAEAVVSLLSVQVYAGLTIAGKIGATYRIERHENLGGTNGWQPVIDLILPGSPHLFFDPNSGGKPRGFYRATPLP